MPPRAPHRPPRAPTAVKRAGRVDRVVCARHRQRHLDSPPVKPRPARRHRGVSGVIDERAVGGHSARSAGRSHTTAPSSRAPHELTQRLFEIEPRAIGRVMVELGVGQHRDLGPQPEQRAIGLIRLDDDPLAAPPAGVDPGVAKLAPDDVGRVEPAAAQDVHDHRRGRRLAVGAGDRQAAAKRRDLREQLRAMQLASAGGETLGVVRRHRGRVHDLGAGGDVLGPVPEHRLDPVLAQPLHVAGLRPVRAGDRGAELAGDDREPAHPRPADADEVEPPRRPVLGGPGHSSRSSTTTGISRAVLRWYSS